MCMFKAILNDTKGLGFFLLLSEREEMREENIDEREKHQLIASHMHTDQGSFTSSLRVAPTHAQVFTRDHPTT